MTPERWRRVEELCHAALARPAVERSAFLAEECAADDALRHDVESLLAQSSRADGFLRRPAAALAGPGLLDQAKGSLTGRRVGDYTIHTLLGVGGMGQVYRAHDETLGRDVAIKVLPPAFTTDPQRRARFEREARLLATVNHPNIGSIYGLVEAGSTRALVLELVEGETLAERIAATAGNGGRRPDDPVAGLPLADVFRLATQIAAALDAAHEKGIVHRDLKPANIKITPQGTVKVLDFGLAKATGINGADSSPAESAAGIIIGTAAYMSPEQARGLSVDRRGDIWAFGCVLYEMLSGRLAFAGDTASDTIARILEHEPDWSALPPATPPTICRLLRQCLAKDSNRRLRDIRDICLEIEAIAESPTAAPETTSETRPARKRIAWGPWIAAAVVAAAAIGARDAMRPPNVPANPLADAQFSRFTDWDGSESGAEISPDGKFVAFVADHDGPLNLWVSQVGTGRFQNLTRDLPPLSPPNAILRTFGFTADGAEIWFAQAGDASAPKALIPLTGGAPRAFLGQGAAAPSWSPDNARLAYFTNGDGDPLWLADRTSADPRRLPVDGREFFASGVHNHNPIWSPDGQWLYFAHGPAPTERMDIWRVRPAGGAAQQLTALAAAANFVALIDSRTALYIARGKDRSGPWLWSLDVETKVTRRVTTGLEHFSSVSASRDGRRIVATVSNPTATLWRVPLLARPAEERDVQPYPSSSGRAFAPRFGGSSLFYLSGNGAGDGLWRLQNGIPFEVWRATDDSLTDPAAVSPDGLHVVIILKRDGQPRLVIVSADGTDPRTLAPSIVVTASAGQSSADWSPDGRWIAAAGRDARGPGLFKIPIEGGEPVRLVTGDVVNPVWSPDGTLIVYGGRVVGGQVTLLGVRPDGTAVELPDVRARIGGGHRFLRDSSGLVYLPRGVSLDFWLLDLASKTTRALTHLDNRGGLQSFDLSPDGKWIVFDRSHNNSDIALIELGGASASTTLR